VSKRCEEHSKRWRVTKRDGVWAVLDQAGRLRYASAEHHMALCFALTRGAAAAYKLATAQEVSKITDFIDHEKPDELNDLQRMQRAIERLFRKRDEEENP
jgi:hypothetical protein